VAQRPPVRFVAATNGWSGIVSQPTVTLARRTPTIDVVGAARSPLR
jgi:hypothetical protein